jgi:hypothetical protein
MKQAEALTAELRKVWARKLALWWDYYNEEYVSGALRRPLFRLSRGERTLGRWDGTRRTIAISESHIKSDPWLSVMETLRHEMAHQYVSEVLKADGEPPHGAGFQEACKRLRCGPRAGIRVERPGPAPGGADEEKLLRVIKKLLSLANSPNAHEAQTAVKKARFLLTKYNVDLLELDEARAFETRALGAVKGRHAAAELWLATILSDFFFVEVIWAESYDAIRDRVGSVLQVYGTSANLEMAEYVYTYLSRLLYSLWEDYKASNGVTANRERQRYFAGVLQGFHGKLREQASSLQETHALVWKGDAKLKAFYRYLNPRVERRYGGAVRVTSAYRDGIREGRRVTIYAPVGTSAAGTAGYLTQKA